MKPTPMLDCQRLSIAIGSRQLVTDLTAQFQTGQRWALLGANGAGKSTLLRTLAGLQKAASGQVRYLGRPAARMTAAELARVRAFTEQQTHDAFSLTVFDYVTQARAPRDGLWQFSASDAAIGQITEALKATGTDHLAARDIRALSGGERQRVAIAAALAQHTPCLLLDEPTAYLDPAHQLGLLGYFTELTDRVLVLAMHDVNLALRYCSHGIVLQTARTIAGPIDQVITEPTLQQAYGAPAKLIEINSAAQPMTQVIWL